MHEILCRNFTEKSSKNSVAIPTGTWVRAPICSLDMGKLPIEADLMTRDAQRWDVPTRKLKRSTCKIAGHHDLGSSQLQGPKSSVNFYKPEMVFLFVTACNVRLPPQALDIDPSGARLMPLRIIVSENHTCFTTGDLIVTHAVNGGDAGLDLRSGGAVNTGRTCKRPCARGENREMREWLGMRVGEGSCTRILRIKGQLRLLRCCWRGRKIWCGCT